VRALPMPCTCPSRHPWGRCIRTGAAFPLSEAANALDVTHRMHRMGPHRMRHRNSFAIASTASGPG
jgi:hypothetical protein